MVDVLDDSAKHWGAVNTIRFEGRDASGAWLPIRDFADDTPEKIRSHGFNTDADAIARALREDLQLELRGARVLVLGAGGAGRVAALKLAAENVAELFLINRTPSKAASVAAEIRRRQFGVKVQLDYPRGELDLVLNATSLGLAPEDPLPFEPSQFSLRQARSVYDMIYRPAETPLLAAAKAAGCRAANGLGMLLYQGTRALELWSGKTAPESVMRQALEKNVYGN
jgi:shikimate dehydrogenase